MLQASLLYCTVFLLVASASLHQCDFASPTSTLAFLAQKKLWLRSKLIPQLLLSAVEYLILLCALRALAGS